MRGALGAMPQDEGSGTPICCNLLWMAAAQEEGCVTAKRTTRAVQVEGMHNQRAHSVEAVERSADHKSNQPSCPAILAQAILAQGARAKISGLP